MNTTYRVRDEATWHELDGEIVVLDTAESVYYSIGGVGAKLWPMLVQGATRDSLVDHITSTFPDVPAQDAATDVDEFIESCFGNGLVEKSSQ